LPAQRPEHFVERLGSQDFPAIEALFNAVFSWKPVPGGFAAWRYGSAEIGGFCVGARDSSNGKLVAAHGVQLLPTTAGRTVGLSVDVMVHPACQRMGLGARMEERVATEARSAGCALLMCFPNPKLSNLRKKLGQWVPALRARAYSIASDQVRAAGGGWRASADPPAGIGRLWSSALHEAPGSVGIDRNDAYLAWRFAKNPLHAYHWVALEAAGELQAAAVTKVWVDPITGVRSGDIVDLFLADAGAAGPSIAAACDSLTSQSVSRITLWAPALVADSELARLGFAADPALSRVLQVRNLEKKESIDFSRWYLTQSDTDLY
jgi:GNAT superfamily N-acetyltransferase